MPTDPVVLSALIGAAGLAIAALFGKLPDIIEALTSTGKARAETRKAEADADRINAEIELTRAQRDGAEIKRLSNENRRLTQKLLDNNIDPSDSRPMGKVSQ